ncbi:hypothetical protein KQI63_15900 [bacterium]|nr:hypothetical protein [bacterium]
MALDAGRIATAVKATLTGEPNGWSIPEGSAMDTLIDAVCAAVVTEITTNAAVSVTVPASGIVAPNGPCTGSASGTGGVA